MRTSSNYALRLPASLKRAIEEVAREDGTTLNQFIVSALRKNSRCSRQRIILRSVLLALIFALSIV